MGHKYANNPEEETQENDVRAHIVNGERKPPDGQNGTKLTEDKCSDCP